MTLCNPGPYMTPTPPPGIAVHCSEDLSGLRKGDISSPSWPAPYAMNADCLYTLSVEDHLQVELHFSEGFDVEQSQGHCIDALMVKLPPFIFIFVQSADISCCLLPFLSHFPCMFNAQILS